MSHARMPTIAQMYRATAAQLEALEDCSFEALSGTVLGESCTRAEIRQIADDPDGVQGLIDALRQYAEIHESAA